MKTHKLMASIVVISLSMAPFQAVISATNDGEGGGTQQYCSIAENWSRYGDYNLFVGSAPMRCKDTTTSVEYKCDQQADVLNPWNGSLGVWRGGNGDYGIHSYPCGDNAVYGESCANCYMYMTKAGQL